MTDAIAAPDTYTGTVSSDFDADSLAALYALRLIIGRGMVAPSAMWGWDTYTHGLSAMGLPELINTLGKESTPADLQRTRQRMQHRLDELEAANLRWGGQLAQDLEALTTLFGLNAAETAIVTFCVLLATYEWFQEITFKLGDLAALQTYKVISIATRLAEPVVRKALAANGVLRSSGLITIELRNYNRLTTKLGLLPGLLELLAEGRLSRETLLAKYTQACVPSTLNHDDYCHLESEVNLALAYIRHALYSPTKGMNILLYGPPGTGKTELARLIVTKTQASGVEVPAEDQEGESVTGDERLQAYRSVQRIAAEYPRLLVIFDEAEDVFFGDENEPPGQPNSARGRKAWINKSLETNLIPAIWITNRVKHMDKAFLRRFDLVIEVPTPPRHARLKMLSAAWTKHGASEKLIESFASASTLSPAILATAARVAHGTSGMLDGASVLAQVVTGHLHAVGINVPNAPSLDSPLEYDPSLINCSMNPDILINGMQRCGAGRILFDGAPGTGKTELARHITHVLGRDVIDSGATQLLSPYIGESERNIAALFQQATKSRCAILLDEVDSLLTARNDTSRSWEVTLVNEFLRQLEQFPGILIATTNRIANIDAAARRRFDIIAKFSPLTTIQLEAILNRVLQRWGGTAPISDLDIARMKELPELTFGEISAAVRRCELFGEQRLGALIAALIGDHLERQPAARVTSLNRSL